MLTGNRHVFSADYKLTLFHDYLLLRSYHKAGAKYWVSPATLRRIVIDVVRNDPRVPKHMVPAELAAYYRVASGVTKPGRKVKPSHLDPAKLAKLKQRQAKLDA